VCPSGASGGPSGAVETGYWPLSEREREIVRMLADGHTGAAIAAQLYISPLTVQTHVRNAMKKRGALTRTHLVAVAVRDGLL
jgi:DNA-binding CsgD family transcriptional regulator